MRKIKPAYIYNNVKFSKQVNLDVKSYDDDELYNLLNLQYPYNKDDIAISCDRLKQQIGGDMNLEEREKRKSIFF